MLSLVLLLAAPPQIPASVPAPAATEPPSRAQASQDVDDPGPDTWMLRLGVGGGDTVDSEHAQLMRLDGYTIESRVVLDADLAIRLSEPFYGGIWIGYGIGSASHDPSPKLKELCRYLAVQLPIVFRPRMTSWFLAPRVGASSVTLSIGDEGDAAWGYLFGGEASVVLNPAHLGFGVGYYWAPIASPTGVGRQYDVGGWQFRVFGGFYD